MLIQSIYSVIIMEICIETAKLIIAFAIGLIFNLIYNI